MRQPDVVPGSMINATGHGESLQIAQVSDSAGFSPNVGPQNTDAPEPQEGEIENFDADRHDLCAINATEVEAASLETKENGTQGSSNFSLKRDSLQSQVSSEYALDLFITDPNSYSREITVLEHRILQLGPDAFKEIKEDDETRRYVLPLRHLDAGLDPLTPFSPTSDQQLRINGYIQLQVSMSIETLSSIIAGTRLLKHEGFCNSSTYNIIVADIDRPKVLNVRPVSMPSLSLLLELLREVQEFIRQEDNQRLDSALDDIAEILLHIVVSLGLGIPQTVLGVDKYNLERQQDICHLLSSILSLLHVALLSFVRSHLDNSGHTPSGSLSDGLHIECPGGTLFLTSRRLKCLNGLLKQPVWAISFIPTNSTLSKVECDGFYLSSSIDHLAELWGPLRLNSTGESTASSIETHGGRLLSAEDHTSLVQPLESEVLCHWSSWMETNSLENTTPIDTAKLLLIGVRTIPQAARKLQRLPRFNTIDMCDCSDKYISQPRHREFELGTRPPKWKMNERTAQASGGQYVTITLGFTYKFDAGWTLKDVILEDWVNAGKTDASHIPNRYLKFNDGVEEFRDITSLLDRLGSIDSLSSIWTTIPVTQRKLLIFSFKTILKILKFTGIGEDKKLQAWDITSHDRIDGRRLVPRWSSFVKDDSNSARFAVITRNCIRYSQSNDQALTDTVLQTQLCITAAQRINRSLAAPEKDAEMQGTQSNSSATFSSRWAVNRSRPIDVKCRQSADRYQTMNTDSGQPPPVNQSDAENKLLDRIRDNQRKRQIVSNAASQPSCTGDDPSILASQHPSNNPSPSRKRPKTGTCDMPP
ncbi:uncharacterized protein EAE98_011202 [Botrytis deweyae]|uniref:Uncharacterized protein n=1 Tax=Botrytis deweyae TaxID=2478750 RepID=A0ABQ7I6J3_9HELO|nr:uncharacterized protein EAE98_011202 [Botrytis deweyae]KAF7915336.1 hypothetical protein EAE98_011202 [Botrytis deweyae]